MYSPHVGCAATKDAKPQSANSSWILLELNKTLATISQSSNLGILRDQAECRPTDAIRIMGKQQHARSLTTRSGLEHLRFPQRDGVLFHAAFCWQQYLAQERSFRMLADNFKQRRIQL